MCNMKALSGKKVMAKVKVFVHASHADADSDADADGMAMTLAPWTYVPARKKCIICSTDNLHLFCLGVIQIK